MSMPAVPTRIHVDKQRAVLELTFEGQDFELPAELLRVCSPSAEVQGHGPDQKTTPLGKENVAIKGIETQGNYAVKLIFDDGHDTGIYTWSYLHNLCDNKEQYWSTYLKEAESARAAKEQQGTNPVKWV